MSESNPYQYHEAAWADQSATDVTVELRGMRIVGGALILGALFFLGVILFLGGFQNESFEKAGMIAWIGVGFGVLELLMSYVMPPRIERRALDGLAHREQVPASEYLGVYRGKMVVGQSLAEGGAFMNILMYFLDVQLMNLGMVGVLVGRIAMLIPTRGRLIQYLREQGAGGEEG